MNTSIKTNNLEIVNLKQWVVWKSEIREDKPTKVPYRADGKGKASATNPDTWATYTEATTAYQRGGFDGIGFVFTKDDQFTGIDLDKCRDKETGEIEAWASDIIKRLNSYTEITPSGTGLHILIKANLPAGGNRKGNIEIYYKERYFTFTGNHLEGTPDTIEYRQAELDALHSKTFSKHETKPQPKQAQPENLDDTELIEKAFAASNGAAFRALWDGDTSAHNGDDSAADMALCCHLAFWTGNDAVRIDRLFRRSGLYREKWERNDYRERTIQRAIESTPETYSSRNNGHRTYKQANTDQKFTLDDIGNSERFISRHGENCHYVADRRIWQTWDGKRWKDDITGDVIRYGKETAKSILIEAYKEQDDNQVEALKKHSKSSSSNMRVKAMIELSQPELAVTVQDLDKNIDLLNVKNGTIALRTGELRPHNRNDKITSIIDIDYIPDARSELFETFLNDTFEGDQELIDYMRVWFGYCATGSQIEQKFQFWFGPLSNNGKSTLSGAIKHVLGPYAGEIDPTNFMVVKNSNSAGPNESLAGLYNKRVVFATEIQDGMTLNSALIKRMRGGESIHFERKFEHGFDAEPTYKLILSGNHQPKIKDTTNATWRSMDNVPFNYYVPDDKRIKNLREVLIQEHSQAILAWIVSGAVTWYRQGLKQQPGAIKAATQEYRNNEDILHDYLAENCLIRASESILGKELYSDYKSWCEANDILKPIGKTEFNSRLREKNLISDRGHGNKPYWFGIRTLTDLEKQEMVTFDDGKVTNSRLPVTFVTKNQESSQENYSRNENFLEKGNKSNQSNQNIKTCAFRPCPKCGGQDAEQLPDGLIHCQVCGTVYKE